VTTHSQLKEASTHKSAQTHVFCDSLYIDLWLFIAK